MARHKLRRVCKQFRGRVAIHEIGEYYDQRTPMTVCAKEIERPLVTRLDHLSFKTIERFHYPVDLVVAASRRQKALDAARKRNQSYIVTARNRDVSDRQCSVHRMIQLG